MCALPEELSSEGVDRSRAIVAEGEVGTAGALFIGHLRLHSCLYGCDMGLRVGAVVVAQECAL